MGDFVVHRAAEHHSCVHVRNLSVVDHPDDDLAHPGVGVHAGLRLLRFLRGAGRADRPGSGNFAIWMAATPVPAEAPVTSSHSPRCSLPSVRPLVHLYPRRYSKVSGVRPCAPLRDRACITGPSATRVLERNFNENRPRQSLSARRVVRRRRDQFLGLLGGGRARRALPFRCAGQETRTDLPEVTGYCWHGYLRDCQPGQHYGFRVHGPWDPDHGSRCNPAKLLIDPYAKALHGDIRWNESLFPYYFNQAQHELNTADSAPFMPKSVVTNPFFDWGDDRPPADAPRTRRSSTRRTSRGSRRAPGHPAGAARHLCRAGPSGGRSTI